MKKIVLALILLLMSVSSVMAGDLADVQEAGVLRLGTSAGAAPFVFYDINDEVTGIDIRLMEKIAERMGVELEVYDMSADSLTESLMIGQVDVAGGAFSKTSSRKEDLDFTKIYYSTGAVFVSKTSLKLQEPLNSDSFPGLRIGVRKGSCFEEWLKTDFLEKGAVSEKDIYSYSGLEEAMKALSKGKIDLVMMDANVYMARYESNSDYRSWQYGSAEDNYAFAVRKDSDLKSELDKHLSALLKNGTAQEIADSFFNEQVRETEPLIQWGGKTAAPTATATPLPFAIVLQETPTTLPPVQAPTTPAKCTYSMAYVTDVTIPDGTYINPGTPFWKTWRLKNNGTCTWTQDFTFGFVSGDAMGGKTVNLPKTVNPGESVDISVDLIAPIAPGNYQGNWQLKTGQGYTIGTPIWVKITVPNPYAYPTATAIPYTYPTEAVQQSVKPRILWFYPNFYEQKSGECVNVYVGVTSCSTAELWVDGIQLYFGSEESFYVHVCDEVKNLGGHDFELCAYSPGETLCDAFTYITK